MVVNVHENCYVHNIVNMRGIVNTVGPVDLELRLAAVLRELLLRANWLAGWTVERPNGKSGWDLVVSGPLPGDGKAVLCVECKHHFQPSQFSTLVDRHCHGDPSEINGRVLAMPSVSPRMAVLCEQHGWSWFDLAGNCHLEIPRLLLIERSGHEPVRIDRPSVANLSSPEAGRVVRALLSPENAGRRWTQREMVAHFHVLGPPVDPPSLALVNKVVQHLRAQAFLESLPNRGFRVRDYEGLLQEWRQAYRFRRSSRRRYFTLLQDGAVSEKLRKLETAAHGRIAYGVFSAAEIQAPHVRQSRIWLYVTGDIEEQVSATLEAKLVDTGENLTMLIPEDAGVFYQLDVGNSRLACTNAAQTYIDLVNAGGRGEEAAEAVLRRRLKPAWSATADGL